MATAQNFERRKAGLLALNIYNSAVAAFPGGQSAVSDGTQAALTTKATLKTLIAARGVKVDDRARMDRAAEQILDLLDVLGVSDANVAADNTVSAFQQRLKAFCTTGVSQYFQDNTLHWA